jgi:hypothetical protein
MAVKRGGGQIILCRLRPAPKLPCVEQLSLANAANKCSASRK